jgi:hypothetical protein
MTQTSVEILILTISALGCGILMFVSGVIQKIMNDMDAPAFRWFVNKLGKTAMSNPFAVTIATLPILCTVYYFVVYGFNHWWFTAGLIVWLIGSTITKITNMPVYKWLGDPKNTDPEELNRQRCKLRFGNAARAWVTFASIILMACQFGVRDVAIVLGVSLIITPPLLWLARKYMPD